MSIMQLKNISKRFSGTQALDGVSFDIEQGEIHAIMGENGAGKSTLIKIVSGVFPRDGGEMLFEDKPLIVHSPQEARQKGINVVYQELSLVPNLTVAENIGATSGKMNTFKVLDKYNLPQDVLDLLNNFGIDPFVAVKNLGIGAQQMVEIAGAVSRKCKLLILDEPTASLTSGEVDELFGIIRKLKSQGVTIIYISHKLAEVFEIADKVTVLKDGKYIDTVKIEDCTQDKLISMMIGRSLQDMFPEKEGQAGDVILSVKDLSGEGFSEISFDLRKGEVLGLAGLAGAGRTELCTAIFGANQIYSGEIIVEGKKLVPKYPGDSLKAGIGYLPEDRKQMGIFLNQTVKENAIVATLDMIAGALGILNTKNDTKRTLDEIGKLNTKVGSIEDSILSLSGGNQQKIILSRWLMANPKILIVDEPTRGIDVGAKFEIYRILRSLAKGGMAIIMVSSELPEIFGLSDRIIAMYHGRKFVEKNAGDEDMQDIIGAAIVGVEHKPKEGAMV